MGWGVRPHICIVQFEVHQDSDQSKCRSVHGFNGSEMRRRIGGQKNSTWDEATIKSGEVRRGEASVYMMEGKREKKQIINQYKINGLLANILLCP